MKFSVIMSIYNGELYLSKSIESILDQSCKDFEFIIIDDGSTDNSLKIIENYANKDKRIKVIKNLNNIGLTKSLNRAIKYSNGEFIARQDCDDFFLPNHLKKSFQFLRKNPIYAFCGCDGYQIQNNKPLTNHFEFDEIKKHLIAENCFNHSGTVIRKSIFDKYGSYNERYQFGQDYELWCRLIYKYQLKAANLKEKLIIRNMPSNRLLKKNLHKFITQRVNSIKAKIAYIRYSKYKIKCSISILVTIIEILTLTHLIGKFSKFLEKINF